MNSRLALVAASAALLVTASAHATQTNCASMAGARIKSTASTGSFASNNTPTFVSLPESTLNFVQGGNKPSCVIVQFWGNTGANQTGLYLRALIDQVSTSVLPDSPQIGRYPDNFVQSASAIYIIPNVAPGAHKITFQFRSSSNGAQVSISAHNVLVMYAP
jgi:hypothetical protein